MDYATDSMNPTDQSSLKTVEGKRKAEIHLPEGIDLSSMVHTVSDVCF